MPVRKGQISIQKADFSADSELDRILGGKVGGTVIFVGSVRGDSAEGRVPHLDFESFGSMAESELGRIRAEALKKFDVEAVTVVHRTGRIRARGRVVLIAVSAAHRDAAFKACRYVLEELKRRVPIWKKERGTWTCPDLPAKRGEVKSGGRIVKRGAQMPRTSGISLYRWKGRDSREQDRRSCESVRGRSRPQSVKPRRSRISPETREGRDSREGDRRSPESRRGE